MLLQSFLVYGFLGLYLLWLGGISAQREHIYLKENKKAPFWTWNMILSLFLFALISGVRWQVGVDHLSYLKEYQNIAQNTFFKSREVEIGFKILSELMCKMNFHFVFYFMFWAFWQIFFIYFAHKKEQYLFPFIGILIVLGPQYLTWMNGIRQTLAASIFVFSIQFIKNRKLLYYTMCILLAYTIHKSAILLSLFYFIHQKDYFKNRYINLALLFFTLFVGLNPTFTDKILQMKDFIITIDYANYSESLEQFIEEQKVMAIGPRRLVVLLMNILIIWYASSLKQQFKNTNFLIYFNLSFVGVLLHNLLANTHHVFLRPLYYFNIFLVLTTSYLLYYLKQKTSKGISFLFLIVFLITISYTFLSCIGNYGKQELDFSNFKFFWDFST